MTNEQKIKEACCRANPIDMGERSICNGCNLRMCICPQRHLDGDWSEEGRDIHLADVLLAIQEKEGIETTLYINSFGGFYRFPSGELLCEYNLHKDSLSDQSEEVKQFLAELLDKE